MTDYLMWEANKSDARSDTSQARKFHKQTRKNLEAQQARIDKNLRNTYRLPE